MTAPTTDVVLYENPLNIDYLLLNVRIQTGDITGAVYSDTLIRTAIVCAIQYLQPKWMSRYQIYNTNLVIDPQPEDVPLGYEQITTADGLGYIKLGQVNGNVFRNPYLCFDQEDNQIIQTDDIICVVLAATYLLILMKYTSNVEALVFRTWKTEDISFSNLGNERQYSKLIEMAKDEVDNCFKRLPRSIRSEFAISAIPTIYTT